MNEYEKAFVERMAQLKFSAGPTFAALTKEALEREWGKEGDAPLAGLDDETLESPEKLARELYKVYGSEALRYFSLIARYAESGDFKPEEERESDEEEKELESVIQEVDEDSPSDGGAR